MSNYIDELAARAIETLSQLAEDRPVLRRRDLLDLGVVDATQSALIRRGTLTRLRHGVYTLTSLALEANVIERHRLDVAAAIAAAEQPTWAFGPSAAVLTAMPMPIDVPDRVHLVRQSGADERSLRRPSRHRLAVPATQVVTGPVAAERAGRIRGVDVVEPGLAAVSAAATLTSHRWRTALLDSAMWTGTTAYELEALIDSWRHLGHREQLVAALRDARPGAQTVLETFSRLALVERGLPEPELQVPFHDAQGLIGRVDMWWSAIRVVGEADGAVKYTEREDLIREKLREDRLRALGLSVVRWTWQEIVDSPELVASRVWTAAKRVA
jgi:Transcriptional regulator, AbiEi antitoxin